MDKIILEKYILAIRKRLKELDILKDLKKEVDINGNGTREYVIKEGSNKGKVAKL